MSGDDKRIVAERFSDAALDAERFINVDDGAKRSTDHNTRYSDPRDVPGQNYGIYPGGGLVDVDIDDYSDDADNNGLEAVSALADTLTVESPHTDGETGGHRYFHIDADRGVDEFDVESVLSRYIDENGDPTETYLAAKDDPVALTIAEAFGTPNPQPSWGEVRAVNQYVVGPGSQLGGCRKDWCDTCATRDGGWYRVAHDAAIATVTAEEFVDALRADPNLGTDTDDDRTSTASRDRPRANDDASSYDPAGTPLDDVVREDSKFATYLAAGAKAAGFESNGGERDRSDADHYATCRAVEYGVPEEEIRDELAECPHSKVEAPDAGPNYWRSTWSAAVNKADANSKAPRADDLQLSPEAVAETADVGAIGQLKKDRQRAYHTYSVIKDAGTDLFRATPAGEVFWYEDGVWRGGDDGEHRLAVLGMKGLGEWYGKNTLSELVEQVKRRDRIDYDALGVPNGTVATPDGLLCLTADDSHDLQPGDTRDLTPKDYALGRINTAPNPDAGLKGSRWEAFINESVPDATERLKLQEYAGYALLPRQPFKKALFLVGPTDSGKGTFLKALTAVLGEENVANQPLKKLIDSRWGLDKIHGRMVNMSNEVSPKGLKNVETFKEMTGGEDTVTAEKKGQPTYEFTVTQKFLFATNQFPRTKDADDAFFNRCLFVEFPNTVPGDDQDSGLLDTLSSERPVILNWMLDGLARLLERDRFTGERSIDDKRSLTKSFGDPVTQFIYEALDITGEPKDCLHKKELYEAFARFCDFERIDETPVQHIFTNRLKTQPGVSDGESRRVGEAGSKPHVYTGLRVDEAYLEAIQADVPAYAHAEGSSGGDGSTEGRQAQIGD